HYRLAICRRLLNLHGLDQFDGVVGLEILHDSLRNQKQCTYYAEWQQHPKCAPQEIDPEIPDRLHLTASDAANERYRQYDPHRRRHEIVVREAHHLGEIALRG